MWRASETEFSAMNRDFTLSSAVDKNVDDIFLELWTRKKLVVSPKNAVYKVRLFEYSLLLLTIYYPTTPQFPSV